MTEISKMKYRNRIPEPGTTISGFADKKKKINPDRPTLDFYDMWLTYLHTYFFLALLQNSFYSGSCFVEFTSTKHTCLYLFGSDWNTDLNPIHLDQFIYVNRDRN